MKPKLVPSLITLALVWTIGIVSIGLVPGCAHVDPAGVYAGDSFLFNSEQAIVTAKESLDVTVKWEHNNRKLLSGTPAVTKGVDVIRARAPEAFASANRLVAAYKAAPTPENKEALQKALAVVNGLVAEGLQFYLKYGLNQ